MGRLPKSIEPGRKKQQPFAVTDLPAVQSTEHRPEQEFASLGGEPVAVLPLAVSPKNAAWFAGVGRSTLYVALADGELKSIKIGKRRLILIDELRRWLASHEIANQKRGPYRSEP